MVGNSASEYTLEISGYSGTAGDSMIADHNLDGMQFSTYDRDNDQWLNNCADMFDSGWWFNACFYANLNGVYRHGTTPNIWEGIIWNTFTTNSQSLKYADMKIRCY